MGGSTLISGIGGEFSHRDEKQMSLCFCRVTPAPVSVLVSSLSRTWTSAYQPLTPPRMRGRNMSTMGRGGHPSAGSHDATLHGVLANRRVQTLSTFPQKTNKKK